MLNIPLSMILLSCLSVPTLSCGNLLNSALAYGDFLKITNLLIIIIKKHLTGGNSTSKLLCVPQREEGCSATFFYYFVQTVGVGEAILSDPARCKPGHCWGGHSSSWLLGFFLLPTPALICKASEVGGKSWLLPRSANWRRLELCFQGKEFLEVIFKEFCKGGASLTHSGLRSTPIFSGFLLKTNQTKPWREDPFQASALGCLALLPKKTNSTLSSSRGL